MLKRTWQVKEGRSSKRTLARTIFSAQVLSTSCQARITPILNFKIKAAFVSAMARTLHSCKRKDHWAPIWSKSMSKMRTHKKIKEATMEEVGMKTRIRATMMFHQNNEYLNRVISSCLSQTSKTKKIEYIEYNKSRFNYIYCLLLAKYCLSLSFSFKERKADNYRCTTTKINGFISSVNMRNPTVNLFQLLQERERHIWGGKLKLKKTFNINSSSSGSSLNEVSRPSVRFLVRQLAKAGFLLTQFVDVNALLHLHFESSLGLACLEVLHGARDHFARSILVDIFVHCCDNSANS